MVFVPAKEKNSKRDGDAMVKTARDVLNELRWRGSNRLEETIVFFRDRTKPEGFRAVRGSEIVGLDRRYVTTRTARLPCYKISRIECAGAVVFNR